jgi:hypothetical protein
MQLPSSVEDQLDFPCSLTGEKLKQNTLKICPKNNRVAALLLIID